MSPPWPEASSPPREQFGVSTRVRACAEMFAQPSTGQLRSYPCRTRPFTPLIHVYINAARTRFFSTRDAEF
jgi:hypothetical protein